MKLLVCVKQVIDPESPLRIDMTHTRVVEDRSVSYRMNSYDEYALEEALLIAERFSGVHIDALSCGPERAGQVLRRALEKGCHRAFHALADDPPPLQTAHMIANHARDGNYDLIITGVMSDDGMNCLVGPLVASLLGIPCAESVLEETLDPESRTIRVLSELEGGLREEATLPLPAVITVQSGINRPRYPALSSVLRARNEEIHLIHPETVSSDSWRVDSLEMPGVPEQCELLQGTPAEKARQLLRILHEKSLL